MRAEESLRAGSTDALGEGSARRALGLLARAEGRLDDAEQELSEALRVFETIGARLEVGRTHLALAEVTMAQGRGQATLEHLGSAHHLFRALNVPRHVEKVARLARDAGLPSPDTTDALRS
jgi:hypothetical protein